MRRCGRRWLGTHARGAWATPGARAWSVAHAPWGAIDSPKEGRAVRIEPRPRSPPVREVPLRRRPLRSLCTAPSSTGSGRRGGRTRRGEGRSGRGPLFRRRFPSVVPRSGQRTTVCWVGRASWRGAHCAASLWGFSYCAPSLVRVRLLRCWSSGAPSHYEPPLWGSAQRARAGKVQEAGIEPAPSCPQVLSLAHSAIGSLGCLRFLFPSLRSRCDTTHGGVRCCSWPARGRSARSGRRGGGSA